MPAPGQNLFSIRHIAVAAILALALLPAATPIRAAAATELLPDFLMAAPHGVQLQSKGQGVRLLRFGTIVWNTGDGPLEVRARNRSGNEMTSIFQVVKTTDANVWYPVPEATAFYSGDGHNHWHLGAFIDVSLAAHSTTVVPIETRRLRKIGFCLVDLVRAPAILRPANSVLQRGYWVGGCGTSSSKRLRMGISVGWGDDYKPFFTHQLINVTGLPAGTYRLCATVNPDGLWHERADNAANNVHWLDLQLNPAAATVSVVGQGQSPCTEAPPVPPAG